MQIFFSHTHMCLSAIVLREKMYVRSLTQIYNYASFFKKFHAFFTYDQNTHFFKMLVARWDPTFCYLLHMILNHHQSFKLPNKQSRR
jgi:hypothetical protein